MRINEDKWGDLNMCMCVMCKLYINEYIYCMNDINQMYLLWGICTVYISNLLYSI